MQLRPLSWLHKASQHQFTTDAEQEIMLRRAAQASGQSVADFIVNSVIGAAELAVLDQKQFFITGGERQQLIDLQARSAQPSPLLQALLQTPRPWGDGTALSPPQPLAPEHSIFQFDCGRRSMNDWLVHRARQAQLKGSARTFVVCAQQRAVGYFSLTVGQIDSREFPGHGNALMDREWFPVPVVVLTRLAVDRMYQGKGMGRALLREVVDATMTITERAGVEALLTQPLDERAARFYQSCGFAASPAAYKQLILLIKDIEAARQQG